LHRGVNYRVDGLLQYSDGFRGLKNYNYEFRPEWSWTKDNHFVVLALDVRHIERTPDTTYDFTIAGIHGFRAGAGVSYNSMTFGSTANNVWIPSSTVIDTMFGYYAPHWDAEVSIKNIVDVEYFTTAQSAGGYVGQPRTYYGRLAWHY
jgi:hypothetical protein